MGCVGDGFSLPKLYYLVQAFNVFRTKLTRTLKAFDSSRIYISVKRQHFDEQVTDCQLLVELELSTRIERVVAHILIPALCRLLDSC